MRRLLIPAMLALAACGSGAADATTSSAPPTAQAAELVGSVPASTMYSFCDSGKAATERGATALQIVTVLRDSLREYAIDNGMQVDDLVRAVVQWCIDHGYQ